MSHVAATFPAVISGVTDTSMTLEGDKPKPSARITLWTVDVPVDQLKDMINHKVVVVVVAEP